MTNISKQKKILNIQKRYVQKGIKSYLKDACLFQSTGAKIQRCRFGVMSRMAAHVLAVSNTLG